MNVLTSVEGAPWQPQYYTKPLTFDIDGEQVVNYRSSLDWVYDWTPLFLKSYSDFQEPDSPFRLTAWQRWVVESSSELDYDGSWRYRRFLCLVGRKNGKTEVAALLILSHLLTAPSFAEIYSAAVNTTQARLCFDKVKRWIEETPDLAAIFHVQDSENKITNKITGTYYRALASDNGRSVQGLNPYFIVMDELHVWDDGGEAQVRAAYKFYDTLVTAAGARRQSQIFIISTAGENVNDSLLGKIYRKAISISQGKDEDDTFGMAIWEVPADHDPLEEKNWYLASPNLAEGFMNISYLRSMLKEYVDTNINTFFRYFLNQWVRTTGEMYVSEYHWGMAEDKEATIPPGAKVVAGFDGSRNNDSTVIVVQDLETGVFKPWGLWEKDYNDEKWAVDREDVLRSFRQLMDTYDVQEIRVDGSYWQNELKVWGRKYKIPFQEFKQSRARTVPAGDAWLQDLIEGHIKHTGDEDMTRHVMNTVRNKDGKPSKENSHSRHKIDLTMGAIFANDARVFWKQRLARKNEMPQSNFLAF